MSDSQEASVDRMMQKLRLRHDLSDPKSVDGRKSCSQRCLSDPSVGRSPRDRQRTNSSDTTNTSGLVISNPSWLVKQPRVARCRSEHKLRKSATIEVSGMDDPTTASLSTLSLGGRRTSVETDFRPPFISDVRSKYPSYKHLKETSGYQVLEFLFIGDWQLAQDSPTLQALNIEFLVDMCKEGKTGVQLGFQREILTLSFNADNQLIGDAFMQLYTFIRRARKCRKNVLMYDRFGLELCAVGCIQFLMVHFDMSYVSSKLFLSSACPKATVTQPRYERSLEAFERQKPKITNEFISEKSHSDTADKRLAWI